MTLFNKSRMIIYVEPMQLRYQIIETKMRREEIINFNEIVYQNWTDIDRFIQNLKQQAPRLTAIELNLSDDYIKYQKIAYPEVKLTPTELATYVEASLYKLFQQFGNQLFFDFVSISHKTLMIAVCERDTVNYWIELLQKNGFTLLFIGSHFESNSFNFLPWRKQKAKQHQFQLLLFAVSLSGVMICYFFYLLIRAQSDLYNYSQLLSEQQASQQQLINELSGYIPYPSSSQKQIQQSLQMFSEKMPTTIWLNLYEYEPQKIKITGRSVNYVDIINFNQLVSSNHDVKNSRVKNIENSHDSLLFQMDIELNE